MLTKIRSAWLVWSGWGRALDARTLLFAAVGLVCLAQTAAFVFEAWQGTLSAFTGADNYSQIAENLVKSGFYSMDAVRPSAYRPPIYPLFLALLMIVFGPHFSLAAIVAQAVAGVAVGVLSLQLSWRLFRSRLAALILVGGYVLHYTFLLENMRQRETVIFALLLLLFFQRLAAPRTAATYALLAGLAALGYLTRPTGLFLFPLLLAALLLHPHTLREKVKYGALIAGIALAGIAPWHTYVYLTFRTFSFLPTSTAGINLYHGNNPDFHKIYPYVDVDRLTPAIQAFKRAHGAVGDELAVDRFLKQAAFDYIAAHPVRFFQNALIKLAAFYSPLVTPIGAGDLSGATGSVVIADYRLHSFGLGRLTHLLVIGGMLPGLALFLRRLRQYPREHRAQLFCLLSYLVVVTLLQMVTVGETRYRLPLDPLFFILASEGYAGLVRARRAAPVTAVRPQLAQAGGELAVPLT